MLMVPKLQRGKVLGLVLGYAFWYLAQHPDAQQRIQTELNSQGIDMRSRETVTNSSKRPRAVELDSLPYLRAVIDECLRMRPTSTPLPRITPPNRKVSVAGIDGIPPGTRINTFQWFVHRDPQKWDNAHDWNPDRWLTRGNTDNKNEREDVLWAFASGLRMCLGNNWTYYAMQHILATICSSFNFTALPREENQCWPGSPEDELPIRPSSNTTNTLSRNGKPRSCEPCRKLKARCDHKIPVCGRCRSRCIAHKCSYHPAPLTQSKVSGADVITLYINNLTHPPNQDHGTEASVHGIPSTSQTVLLSDTAVETTMIPEFPNIVDIWLHDIPIRLPRINAISKLAEDVKTATSQQLVVPLDTRPEEFSKILTRPSLRAEAIGLVLSMAGNAAICLLELDIVFSVSDMHVLDRKAFAKDMLFSQRRSHYHC
ncbi:hypothetical protein AFLA_010763 [Aspergillus flavus NRRL3357]|nr:hypothetical protein AFLA_010763 [Aspergillus flavus NRRL3357]